MERALLFLAVFGFAIVGCDGDLLVDNTNPNATTEPSMSGLLSNTILSTSNTTQGAASVTSYYVQHLASPSGSSVDRHFESRFGGTWSGIYGLLSDTEALIEKAEAEDSPHYAGVAQIIQAYNLGLATDLWGDIPYQEALQADEGETTPAYDSQEQVYEEIQTLLSDARDNLDAESRSSPGSDDFVYGGDLEKWRKASWALEARYLNHLTKKSDYDPQAVLSAVGNAFERNADDAQMNYENDPSNNPWHNVYLNQEGGILGGHLSEQLVKEMDGSLYGVFDPRLQVAITDSTETEGDDPPLYAGNRNGAGSGDFYNHLEPKYYASENAPILWITYAEMKFIEAEAALRDGNSGRAYTAYMEGIRAHMDKVGVSESERDAYMNDPAVDVGEDNLTLDEVFKEKNVALFLSPEAWVDHRRHDYDYPDFEPPIDQNPLFQNSQDTDHIRRVLYPLSEIERNRSNVPEVELNQFLWWDQS
ncbi:MAG: SusD/RagB family nutrient-binding outer membrane lipoprotein [Bacteroidetes bacterium QS_3_64_15]|nr:MAG: SusD/RagB family nutrient-binding outer membrane lipoprotein [Bacteroidetes bacterium QS_3_64_15]